MPNVVNDLTLNQQIGQLMMVGFPGTEPTPELIALIQQQHVGNIILFSRNIQSARQLRTLTSRLQELAREAGQRYPLLIALDQENGMVRRLKEDATVLPGNMALGATGSEQSAYDVARASGLELHALGINLNLAPVVDVNNNPANPVIGVRSFGEDPQQVAQLASAQIRGYQSAGLATCIKHFPGHGDTTTDSHLAMPTVPYAMERLEQIELVPFKRGIATGTDCVMTAHIYFSALMHETKLPATLSPAVVRQLLREQLGFQGVVITDCLEMKAVSETVGVEQGAVLAQQAGNDLLLISHRPERQLAGIAAIKAAVQAGTISSEQIGQSVQHILKLKEHLLQYVPEPTLNSVGCEAHQQLRDQIYARSLTLVKDTAHMLPLRLKPEQHLLVVYPQHTAWTQVEDKRYPDTFLVESLCQHHAKTTAIALSTKTTSAEYEALYQAAREADAVLIVTINALLDQRQVEVMQALLATGQPVIGLAVYSPYDLLAFPTLHTYLVTYEYTKPAIAAAVRALFGEIQPQGKLPVSLPGLYPLPAQTLKT
jgi:beta-N-acetylhexosaminidase